MKTLYLLRHAKAESKDSPDEDHDRALIKQGRAQIQKVARRFGKRTGIPDVIVTSDAVRAKESAAIFAKTLGLKKARKIATEEQLYAATSTTLYRVVKGFDDALDSAVLVGHNPAFDAFASSLIKGFTQEIPTSGLVGIEFQVDSWKAIRRDLGVLKYFDFPKRKQLKAKRLNILRQDIESAVSESIKGALHDIDPASAQGVDKSIRNASKDIAADFVGVLKKSKAINDVVA